MPSYISLKQQIFQDGLYRLEPIHKEHRYIIMKWRNEQLYHLRQIKPLTKEDQDCYFEDVIGKQFYQEKPDQILFSFFKGEDIVGYGGLVHINWEDSNAEVSFIMATELEKQYFEDLWVSFLSLIDKVAFNDIGLHKLTTYAYDLRPQLYSILEAAGFNREGILIEHHKHEGNYINVVIHGKINSHPYML